MSDDNNSSGLGWFFLGLGIGTVLGVLFAPKSGSETREYLRTRAGEGADYIKNNSQNVREVFNDTVARGKEFVEKGKDVVSRQSGTVKSAFEAGKKAYRDVAGEADRS